MSAGFCRPRGMTGSWPYPAGHASGERRFLLQAGTPFAILLLIGALTACQGGASGTAQSYPELRTVPPPEAHYSTEARRQIVRDLLEVRDGARYNKAVVRHRSGLSDVKPSAPPSTDTNADDIVQETASGEGRTADPILNDDVTTGSPGYGNKRRIDNGSLDDFIRQLRRDTLPAKPASEPTGEGSVDESALIDPDDGSDPLVVLNALAPYDPPLVFGQDMLKIQLAASEGGSPWYCMFLAWSGFCAAEEQNAGGADGEVAADVDRDEQLQDQTVETTPEPSPSESAGEQAADDAVATEDTARAIEDLGDSAMAPVTDSLDRLRNLLRSRTSKSSATARDDRSLAYQDEALEPVEAPDGGPPTPSRRPDIARDLVVLDDGGNFVFSRTPRPAFKPTPPEADTAILPPVRPSGAAPSQNRRRPERRPDNQVGPTAADQQREQNVAEAVERQLEAVKSDTAETTAAMANATAPAEPSASSTPSTSPKPASPATSTTLAKQDPDSQIELVAPLAGQDVVLGEQVIRFEPNATTWPAGTQEQMVALLADAETRNGKIHIIGEAGLSHLATARAKDVGQALVQLGATADLLHYDTAIVVGADQVRLLLKPAEPDPREAVGSSR